MGGKTKSINIHNIKKVEKANKINTLDLKRSFFISTTKSIFTTILLPLQKAI